MMQSRAFLFILLKIQFLALFTSSIDLCGQALPQTPGVSLTPQEREWLAQHPVIKVAPDPDFPPIERFNEHGEFVGIAADYIALVEKQLGMKFTIVRCATWDEILNKAKNREIDLLSAAAQTPNRSEYLLFSRPHIVLPGVIIMRKDVSENISLAMLNGKKVGIVSGYVWQEFIARDFPQIIIDPVPDVQTGLRKVSFGTINAMIENLATATQCIEKEGITNLRVVGETGYYTRLSFASRKDWPELNAVLDKALATVSETEKKAIYQRWIHIERQPVLSNRFFWIVFLSVVSGAAMVILTILAWNRSLSRKVAQRTRELTDSVTKLKTEMRERMTAQQELKESEQKFLEMVENANSIILRMDRHGNVTFFNQFAERFFGFTKTEIMGRNVVGTIVPPVDSFGQNLSLKIDDLVIHPDQYTVSENENICKDGRRVWVAWSNKPILGKDGTYAELLCVGNDITELKRVEAALKNERDFADAVFETAGALVVVLDKEGRIVRFNQTCERVTGYMHEEVTGKPFWDLFLVSEELDMVKARFNKLIAGDFPNQGENYWKTRNGSRRLIEWYNTCLVDKKNDVEYIISTGIDITEKRAIEQELEKHRAHLEEMVETRTRELSTTIRQRETEITERKRAEQALQESESRYRFLFDESPAGSVIIDGKGIVKDVNRSFQNALGYTREDIVGKHALAFIAPYDKNRVTEVLRKRFSGEKIPEEIDTPIIAKDGTIHYINFAGSQAMLYEKGTLSGILLTGVDVTLRHKAEELARRHQEELMRTDKLMSLGILVSGVAHEINNPNNFIILNADNLADIWKDIRPVLDRKAEETGDFRVAGLPYSEVRNEAAQLIAGVKEGAVRIRTIVQHLKDFARQAPADLNQTVDLNKVIEASTTILANMIKKSTVDFKVLTAPDLPVVQGDFQELEQVVINLLTNACEALTDKQQPIEVRTAFNQEEKLVTLSVSDKGRGIGTDILPHIFDPFFTTKRDSGGTGLGLAISYGIVKDHKGTLSVDSAPGLGTTFVLSLPAL